MRILLLNPRHSSIGSRIPDDHLPPLGLLSIGGPLIDDGHTVRLLDADREDLAPSLAVARALEWTPDAVLIGHSGSTSGHPEARAITRSLKTVHPGIHLIYGGVFPSYHWREVLTQEPQIDVVVRGEGEDTTVRLMRALQDGSPLDAVRGIAYRIGGAPRATPPAAVIQKLDDYRVGWELIDHSQYSYWGGRRAVVVQFSRGCPHPCNYCGQRGFWTSWRHRNPVTFAKEIARLHREHGVGLFNFADENPTSSRARWREFCEALIAEKVKVLLVGSTRADDIVRDADLLHLYKQAGVIRFLMGMESTDQQTLQLIRKGSTIAKDREAIRLLRQHSIISMATWVVGFEQETHRDYLRGMRQLLSYDPDQIQMLYVTPHRWTPFYEIARDRKVIQTDQRRWDYKHQVLATRNMRAWQVMLWVKLIEVALQTRPRALARLFWRDPELRHAQRWYTRIGRRVWFFEISNFFRRDWRTEQGPTLEQFWGAPQAHEENAMVMAKKRTRPSRPGAEVPLR
ncbi:MAG: magnesium-protoporphyrin IX monomethyl ester anaerobic oxidative cyclase [Nevskia sp.]|nr:magnesium-protoporphyrin IX monomethyl ester anaerobic oxidative cyclase [Nevskia sp.]